MVQTNKIVSDIDIVYKDKLFTFVTETRTFSCHFDMPKRIRRPPDAPFPTIAVNSSWRAEDSDKRR